MSPQLAPMRLDLYQGSLSGGSIPMQLLIVDPDDGVADVLAKSMATLCGAVTARASDGATAMEFIEHRHVDLAVSEVLLPDISGYDLAERAANHNVAVLLLPGRFEDQRKCKSSGYPHLDRPFSMAALARALPMAMRDAQQIMQRIHQSHAELMATLEQRATLVSEARQLRSASRRLQAESVAIRTQRSRGAVHYGIGTPNSRCSMCRHYVQWRGDLAVRCNRVGGPISPGGWCKLFTRRQ